jgi:hypothetical protein
MLAVANDSANSAPITLASLLGNGELGILAVIIAGGAAGEIFLGDGPRRHKSAQAVIGGSIMIFVMTAVSWISNVSLLSSTHRPESPHQVAVLSIWAFGAAVAFGIVALRISGE